MATFQRARSEEQREMRRRAILDTAAEMLDTKPVSEISLNELSRRVGLAKSNVLRYFESREAILLELLDRASKQWLAEVSDELAAEIDPHAPVRERTDTLAAVTARSIARHPVLCDLLSAQSGVLEHNVSVQVAAGYKRSTLDNLTSLGALFRRHVPELGEEDAFRACGLAVVTAGALWTACRPSASMLAAYEADPALAALRMDFGTALAETIAVVITGTLAR
jgi:AcrR family transcriptional regulator